MTGGARTLTLGLAGLALLSLVLVSSSRTGLDRRALTPEPLGPDSSEAMEPVPQGPFEVFVDGERRLRMPLESVFVLPGDSVEIRIEGMQPDRAAARVSEGTLTRRGPSRWSWAPPDSAGHADLRVGRRNGQTEFTLRSWTLVPAREIEGGRLGMYRVGNYPTTPLGGNPIYLPPPGLVKVTRQNRDTRVSPHFTIGHFVSKQASDFPKYLILRPELLLKLELLLQALVDRGYPVRSFHVMSGYRTPFYNVKVLGNVRYSRHQWGGAADIFVDERPKNDLMDDLNGDGRIGLADIAIITEVVDSLEREFSGFPIGGAGVYRANAVRGPFVHIDVRGVPARW